MPQAATDIAPNAAPAPEISGPIAAFATGTPWAAMPATARHIVRLSLLDWFAVAAAGREEPVSRIVREMAAHDGGTPEASVIGLAGRLPARTAALVNGATSHALDYDDTHFVYIGHPSVAVLPAALAIAERTGAGGPEFMAAALIGVETACRVGDWLGRRHYDLGFHQTATSGAFGAAMAAARLLGLDAARARQALGIAATRASGLKSQFATMGKPFNAGIAASNGVEAALLAAAGFASRDDGLECAQGFAETHGGEMGDPSRALDGLGTRFVFETVMHKFHACCHGIHAALEALGEARDGHGLAPGNIAAVTITVHPSWLRVCDIAEPATGLEAKFSYRLTAAMALAGHDTASLSTYTDDVCRDPELVRLRDRVTVLADASLPDTAAAVRIARPDGTRVEARHDLDRPMPAQIRERRVRTKAASLLGHDRSDALWQQVEVLENANTDVDWPSLFEAAQS